MSRKSVSIVVPRKRAAANGASVPEVVANGAAVADKGVDTWVSQDDVKQEDVRRDGPSSAEAPALTFTVPAEPGWIDLAQSLVLPQVVFWSWTVSAARKNLARFL